MHAWAASLLLLLHSSFMLSLVKVLLKGEVGGSALNSHGNYIVDHGKSWKNHGIVFLNFCGSPGNVFTFVQKMLSAYYVCHIYSNALQTYFRSKLHSNLQK